MDIGYITPREVAERKPEYWFRPISDAIYHLKNEPMNIEYLKMWTGETFIHTGGTAFWCHKEKELKTESLLHLGITHYRLVYFR